MEPDPRETTRTPRSDWERRWQQHRGGDFQWHLDEVPNELRTLLTEVELPPGAAVDVGCGDGFATAHLAEALRPAVGFDIAFAAVHQAREATAGSGACFLVADAALLPFRPGSVSFVFDRGCLQNLPQPAWETYFQEVAQVVRPGGFVEILCSKGEAEMPPLLSKRGVRARMRRVQGRPTVRGPQFVNADLLRRLAPSPLHVDKIDEFPFVTGTGRRRRFFHAVYRRPA